MAALSRAAAEDGPGPLEGLHPDVLLKGVQAALSAGLVDDLDWLFPPAAGVALYMLAAALPTSTEQRELGRRVLARMLAGNAETFTAIATQMAQTSGKGLSSPNVRARIALVTELSLHHGIADGPLCLALVSRREHAREWIAAASTRSLPARRLAAKILERAAREAATRAQMGDTHPLRAFGQENVRTAYNRLLSDRESLVWRYVAVARGLCAGWVPELKEQIAESLKEGLSPTEWRRAATSLAAFGAVRPDEALKMTQAAVKRGLFTFDDPASAASFVWGIPRTMEAEPEVAVKMLDALLPIASTDVAEAVAELRFEFGQSRTVERAASQALDLLAAANDDKPKGEDDGADALTDEIKKDLTAVASTREDQPIRGMVADALDAFVNENAHAAYTRARQVIGAARGGIDALEAVAKDDDAEGRAGSIARRTSMSVLRDLDASLLERPVASDLLRLGGSAEQMRATEEQLDAIHERLAEWIVACESPEEMEAEGWETTPKHATLRLRRLRALLHLVDGDLGEALEDGVRAKRLRALWLRTVKALLEHFDSDPTPVLKRTLLASLARALDALVRFGVCDVIDALLVLAQRIRMRRDFETLAEASMDPDLRHVLVRYARFLRESEPALEIKPDPTADGEVILAERSSMPPTSRLKSLEDLAAELAPEGSARSESLRTVLVRLHGSLVAMGKAQSLANLSTSGSADPDLVSNVETWVSALAQMCTGAKSRLDPKLPVIAMHVSQPRLLSAAIARVISGADPALDSDALSSACGEIATGIPHGIGRLITGLLWQLESLPAERPSAGAISVSSPEQLPAWLPARRTIGGFYVQRALGYGGTASVFVVTRAEDKHLDVAERLALKVPDYNATAARSISEKEFLKMFRDEASALMMLPGHINLARFVTFDVGARPLPILVMELVEGVSLERVISARAFDMKRCLKILDDVLAGLEAMHSVGVGHLDLKPGNVVLRKGEQAVLVDFGLSGRKIRLGCGTGPYGAPEVWGAAIEEGSTPDPAKADVYSFGCLAFEMLTGKILFEAPNEVTQITMHVSHDGFPLPMRALLASPEVGPLAEVLVPTLRRDFRHRPTAEELRADIRAVAAMVEDASWPVALTDA